MPRPETSSRYQTAVLWPFVGYNEFGEAEVDDPIELTVRWEFSRRQTVDSQGATIGIDADALVDRSIAIGSQMWLGELDDLPGTGDVPGIEVMDVVTYSETPDIKNRIAERWVGLKRRSSTVSTPY